MDDFAAVQKVQHFKWKLQHVHIVKLRHFQVVVASLWKGLREVPLSNLMVDNPSKKTQIRPFLSVFIRKRKDHDRIKRNHNGRFGIKLKEERK